MKTDIRNERPDDQRRVEEITRDAFWNLYRPGCSEHYIAHKIREHPDFMPELTFVIEVDGKLIGSIFYTRSKIEAEDSNVYPTVTFGPVSIRPDMHRKGFGRKLIEHSIAAARRQGHRAIVILGYPYHYEPYGFRGGRKYGISMPDDKFYRGLQVLPLFDGALEGIRGHAIFSDVFSEPGDDELDIFDSSFPFREKAVQDSQREYEMACRMLDE